MAVNLLLQKYQVELVDDVLTDVYECPEKRTTSVTIFLCNGEVTAATIMLALALEGVADSTEQYLYRNTEIKAGNTMKISLTLNEKDVVRVKSSSGAVIICNVFVDQSRPLARI